MDVNVYLKNDKFAEYTGIELLTAGNGKATARLKLKPYHFNAYGTLHGGAVFTLADFAFAAACNSHGTKAVGINANVSYFKAVDKGEIIAEAEEVSLGSKLGSYVVKVYHDKEVVAIFQGMAYRKKDVPLG
jgi:acyl-CoA thioesterase